MRLSRIFFAAVPFILVMGATATAQVPVGLGFRAGINLANASLVPEFSTSSRTGLMIGGVLELGIGGPLYIQAEPSYTQK